MPFRVRARLGSPIFVTRFFWQCTPTLCVVSTCFCVRGTTAVEPSCLWLSSPGSFCVFLRTILTTSFFNVSEFPHVSCSICGTERRKACAKDAFTLSEAKEQKTIFQSTKTQEVSKGIVLYFRCDSTRFFLPLTSSR